MSNYMQGRIVYVGETTQVTQTFRKRSLLFVTGEDRGFSEYFRAEAVQDNVSRLDPIQVNDIVRIQYFLGGQKEVKLDRNNEPSAICSIKISSIEKIGADPNGPIPDILRTQGTAPAQPMAQGMSNEQWMNQQHAQQQGYQQQGYGAAPQQPAQQQGWGQTQAPQAAPQQGWPQPTQQQGPPPGTIPPTSSPV